MVALVAGIALLAPTPGEGIGCPGVTLAADFDEHCRGDRLECRELRFQGGHVGVLRQRPELPELQAETVRDARPLQIVEIPRLVAGTCGLLFRVAEDPRFRAYHFLRHRQPEVAPTVVHRGLEFRFPLALQSQRRQRRRRAASQRDRLLVELDRSRLLAGPIGISGYRNLAVGGIHLRDLCQAGRGYCDFRFTRGEDGDLSLMRFQRHAHRRVHGIARNHVHWANATRPRIPEFGPAGGTKSAFGPFGRTHDEVDVARADLAMGRLDRLFGLNVARNPLFDVPKQHRPNVAHLARGKQGDTPPACRAVLDRRSCAGFCLCGGGAEKFLDDGIKDRIFAARMVARLGQRLDGNDDTAGAEKLPGFLQGGPAHRTHRGQDQHPVRSVCNVQTPVTDLGPCQRLEIHEDEIVTARQQRTARGEGRAGRLAAAQSGLAGSDRIHHRDVALVDALAHQVGEPLEVLQERPHVIPVRHPKVVTGRCPFPKTAVRGVVQAVQVQQIAAVEIVFAGGGHQVLGRCAPTEAVIPFEPHARAPVEMRNGAGNLALDQIGSSARRVVARGRVPAYAAEIIAELHGVAAAAALITAVDLAPAPVPLEDGDEVSLLGELHLHVHEIQPVLDGLRADVLKHRRQGLEQVITFPLHEFLGQVAGPNPIADAELQLVVEEVVQSFGGLPRRMVLEGLEEFLDDPPARQRMNRVERARLASGGEDPDFPVAPFPVALRGRPIQTLIVDRTGQIDVVGSDSCRADRIGPYGNRVGRKLAGDSLTRRDTLLASDRQFASLDLGIAVDGAADQALTVWPIQGISAQADPHSVLAAPACHQLPHLPPLRRKNLRFGGISRPAGRVFMRIVDLHPGDALLVQFFHLPQKSIRVQRISGPPPKRHFAIAGWRTLETRQGVQRRIARRVTFRAGSGRAKMVRIAPGRDISRRRSDCTSAFRFSGKAGARSDPAAGGQQNGKRVFHGLVLGRTGCVVHLRVMGPRGRGRNRCLWAHHAERDEHSLEVVLRSVLSHSITTS